MFLILANLSFPGTLNFIGEFFSIVSLGNIDYSLISLILLNVLLTSCYSFFTMSIVYLVGQAQIYECYKDTNRIECSFMFLLFGIIAYYNTTDCNECATAGCFGLLLFIELLLMSRLIFGSLVHSLFGSPCLIIFICCSSLTLIGSFSDWRHSGLVFIGSIKSVIPICWFNWSSGRKLNIIYDYASCSTSLGLMTTFNCLL